MQNSKMKRELATVEKAKEYITRFGGTITNVDDWGKKRLAYEIQKMKEGFYYFIQFDAETSAPAEIEKHVRIMENVIRYLCVKTGSIGSRQKKEIHMNKVILMGRLTRDPEVRYSQGENAKRSCTVLRLAVDRRFKQSTEMQTADFFNCTAFGRQAEFAEKISAAGNEDGCDRQNPDTAATRTEMARRSTACRVIVEELEFAESKAAAGSNDGGYHQPADRPSPAAAVGDGFMNIPDGIDEELPFN